MTAFIVVTALFNIVTVAGLLTCGYWIALAKNELPVQPAKKVGITLICVQGVLLLLMVAAA